MADFEQQLLRLVEKALDAKDIGRAAAACRELNTRFPDFFDGWRIAGEIHAMAGKPEAVLLSTEKAEAIRPGDPVIALQRVEAYIGCNDLESARSGLIALDEIGTVSVAIHDRLGRHMASFDLHAEAERQYQKALQLEPDHSSLLFNLATAQRFLGKTSEAVLTLDKALEIDKFDFEAQAMRSSLAKQSAEANHIAELEGLLKDTKIDAVGQTSICYALAKEYDDIDQPQASFAYLKRGADLRRSRMKYRVETDIEIINEIRRVYSSDFFARDREGDPCAAPIFILGLPRTGTTLVERILSSHSAVHSAGELDDFGREMVRLVQESGGGAPASRTDMVARCSELSFSELGRAYVDSTRAVAGAKPRFIDKLPFNYLYAGLIHSALPNARIIHVERHPMAACYAIYKQLFRDPYPFSYDLEDLAHYYVAYRELMQHWKDVMPGTMHTVRYEDVVNTTEDEARQLLAYCDLDWEDRCLRFYENEQAVTTASAAQVRQPVYRSSLSRWQAYREYLRPLEKILQNADIDLSQDDAQG